MVFQRINIRQVPWEMLKTAAFGLGFKHLPRDLANVHASKTMFDPYIKRCCNDINVESTLNELSFNVVCLLGWLQAKPNAADAFGRRHQSDVNSMKKAYLWRCVPSENPDQPAHSHSLIRIFTKDNLDS